MKTRNLILSAIVLFVSSMAMAQPSGKLVSKQTHVKFFSSTPAEDIEANNYAAVSTFSTETGEGIFSVPMQSFEFEKTLMQKHYNSKKVLDTKTYPKAKLKGKINNISGIDFSKDGTYEALISGDLTIKGETKTVNEKATITIEGSKVSVNSKFNITLADYGVEFFKGKMASNIAKTIEITVMAQY